MCFNNGVCSQCFQITKRTSFHCRPNLLQAIEIILKRENLPADKHMAHNYLKLDKSGKLKECFGSLSCWSRDSEEESCRRWSQRENHESGEHGS